MKIIFEETSSLNKREREWLIEENTRLHKTIELNTSMLIDRAKQDIKDDSMMDFLRSQISVNEAMIGFIQSCLINNELPEFEKNNI
tara:strand:+ start:393 stop:650 length:258 start_codon:yes stop_codon:yes gene_type:complete